MLPEGEPMGLSVPLRGQFAGAPERGFLVIRVSSELVSVTKDACQLGCVRSVRMGKKSPEGELEGEGRRAGWGWSHPRESGRGVG